MNATQLSQPTKLPRSQLEVSTMLMRQVLPDLKCPEKLLLVLLSTYGDETGMKIFPSLGTLAAQSGMSKAAVCTNLNKLEEKNYIARNKGGMINGRNVTTWYQVNLEKLGYEYNPKTGKPQLKLVR